MTRSPLWNAIVAAMYIVVVASVMYYGPRLASSKETVLIPIAVLSLFVLSAAIMGYIFLYQPVQMYLEGQKKEATDLCTKTLVIFAGITVVFLVIVFTVSV